MYKNYILGACLGLRFVEYLKEKHGSVAQKYFEMKTALEMFVSFAPRIPYGGYVYIYICFWWALDGQDAVFLGITKIFR